LVSVPATIITSDWRGEARGREAEALDVIARHRQPASSRRRSRRSPKVIHISEPVRAQVDQIVASR
jgi:hypothetical protein